MHAERLDAVLPQDALLTGVDIAKTNVDQLLDTEEIIGLQPAKEVLLLLARQTGDEADGHAVDVTAATGLGGVDIGVGIDPDHGDLASEALPDGLGRAGNGANGNAVVAAESEDQTSLLGVRVDLLGNALGHVGDGARVLHVAVGRVLLGDEVRVEVHFVIAVQLVAELFAELGEEAGLDKGGGGCVDTRLALLFFGVMSMDAKLDRRKEYLNIPGRRRSLRQQCRGPRGGKGTWIRLGKTCQKSCWSLCEKVVLGPLAPLWTREQLYKPLLDYRGGRETSARKEWCRGRVAVGVEEG